MLLRRLERWLHQHIFKVGWLLTHNFQTTTILYYTFFLPGVILHEVIYWLAAGVLNIRADRAIQWPETQEIGELKLNFIKLSPRADVYRKAIITAIPLVVGLLIIWFAAHHVFNLDIAFSTMSTGELTDIAEGFRQLTTAPDFWLWFYLVFTIANTMYPASVADLKGWRSIAGVIAIIAVITFIIVPTGTLLENIALPLEEFLSEIQGLLLLLMGINIFMVIFLGFVEYVIEAVSGHSVTFKGGKMITMTRAEAREARQKAREATAQKQARQRRTSQNTPLLTVYALDFPVPDVPGKEPVTQPEGTPAIEIPIEEIAEDVPERREPVFNPDSYKAEPVDDTPPAEETTSEEQAVNDAIRIAQLQSRMQDIAATDDDVLGEEEDMSFMDAASSRARMATPTTQAEPKDITEDDDMSDEPVATALLQEAEVDETDVDDLLAQINSLSEPDEDEELEDEIIEASDETDVDDLLAQINSLSEPDEDDEDIGEDTIEDEPDDVDSLLAQINSLADLDEDEEDIGEDTTEDEPDDIASLLAQINSLSDLDDENDQEEDTTTKISRQPRPALSISPFSSRAKSDEAEDTSAEDDSAFKPATPAGTLRQSIPNLRPFSPSQPSREPDDEADSELDEMFRPATPKGALRRPTPNLRPFSPSSQSQDDADTDGNDFKAATSKSSLSRPGISSFKRPSAPDSLSRDSLRASLFSQEQTEDDDYDDLEYEDYDDVYYEDDDEAYEDYDDEDYIDYDDD